MKVIFFKAHKMGSNSFKKGNRSLIITSIGEQLIEKGICEENNSVTLRDKIIEGQGEEIGEAILEELPDHADDIVDTIPSLSNKYALEHLVTDDRTTVSKAAKKRLKELK